MEAPVGEGLCHVARASSRHTVLHKSSTAAETNVARAFQRVENVRSNGSHRLESPCHLEPARRDGVMASHPWLEFVRAFIAEHSICPHARGADFQAHEQVELLAQFGFGGGFPRTLRGHGSLLRPHRLHLGADFINLDGHRLPFVEAEFSGSAHVGPQATRTALRCLAADLK